MKKYRIVNSDRIGYAVPSKVWYWPFWVAAPWYPSLSVEDAEALTVRLKKAGRGVKEVGCDIFSSLWRSAWRGCSVCFSLS